MKPHWQRHEEDMAELLDLDRTTGSGNQFHDPGDAVSREHYTERAYPIYAECKSTTLKSYSLKRDDIGQWARRAQAIGKMLVMPIRFVNTEKNRVDDYVLVPAEEFSEILLRLEGLCK